MERINIGGPRKSELQERIHQAVKRIRSAPDEQDAHLHIGSLLGDLLDEIADSDINRDMPDPAQSHLAASDLAAANYVSAIHEWRRILTEPTPPSPESTFVHVTYHDNLEAIQAHGLLPQRGERVQAMDDVEGVYLFTDLTTAEDALSNWLGDTFDDDKDLVFLEISLREEDMHNLHRSEAGFEVIYRSTIPPGAIQVISVEPAVKPLFP